MKIRCLCMGLMFLLCCLPIFGSSIWSPSSVPAVVDSGDSNNLELGVKFESDVAGSINGIRFYKSAANTGAHVGHLWTSAGVLLGSVTFANETASGWQQANFAVPIQIQAGVIYVASYWCPVGHYSLSRPYFTTATDNPPLHALADGGVYLFPAGYPTATYQQSNYWVDVDFSAAGTTTTNANLSVTGVSPASGALAGGTPTKITGTGFQPGARVSFGGKEGTANVVTSPTQMQATSPAGAGTVVVTVKNLDSADSKQTFTFSAITPPLITSVLPPTGATVGGTLVAIGGSNFIQGATVLFGGVPAQSVVVVSPTQITCLSPIGIAGSVPVTVINPDGQSMAMVAAFIYTFPIPVPPVVVIPPVTGGGAGLLSGMTPANVRVPAGWTLVRKQDFEGSAGAGEQNYGSITTGLAHSGSKSLVGQYTGDGQGYAWFLNGQVNSREVYVSWFEYIDSQMRFNDEMFMARFFLTAANGSTSQELVLDWYGMNGHVGAACDPTSFNSLAAEIVFIGQSVNDRNSRVFGGCGGPRRGSWDQWEVHFKANDPNVRNGMLQVYQNGVMLLQSYTQNFNYGTDMTGQSIELGGVYTKLVWGQTSNGACNGQPARWAGEGTDNCGRARESNFNLQCYFPSTCPPSGRVPIFKRYFDDIIVLKR